MTIKSSDQKKLKYLRDFLSNYKGKNATSFAEQIMWDKNQTYEIIKEQHYNWKKYMSSNI